MKNNMAEAVLVSPDEYVEMMDTINDYLLLTMAVERMSAYNPNNLVPEVEMERKLNITQEDLDAAGEVEIE